MIREFYKSCFSSFISFVSLKNSVSNSFFFSSSCSIDKSEITSVNLFSNIKSLSLISLFSLLLSFTVVSLNLLYSPSKTSILPSFIWFI